MNRTDDDPPRGEVPETESGRRTFDGPARASVEWRVEDAGTSVVCTVATHTVEDGPVRDSSTRTLTLDAPAWTFELRSPVGAVTGSLELECDRNSVTLHGRIPYDPRRWYDVPIAAWQRSSGPDPPPPPPPPPPDPSGHGDRAVEVTIENPEDPVEVGALVWTRMPDPAPTRLAPGRAFGYPRPADLPLVVRLREQGGDGPKLRAAAASFFEQPDVAKIRAVGDLRPAFARLPELRTRVLALEGDVGTDALLRLAETELGVDVGEWIDRPEVVAAHGLAWQLVYAYALVPTRAPCLQSALVTVLRGLRFLSAVVAARDGATTESWRRSLLDGVPFAPSGTYPTDVEGEESPSWIRLAGVGQLKRLLQVPVGYALGDVAETINLLPNERLELVDRSVERTRTEVVDTERETDRDETSDADEERGNFRSALQSAMAAASDCRNFDDLTWTYSTDGLQATIGGSECGSGRSRRRRDRTAADFARELARRATREVERRVVHRRVERKEAERERVARRAIDNTSATPVTGYYRWLDRRFELVLRDDGRRLVLEVLLERPAGPFLRDVHAGHGRPLEPPPPYDPSDVDETTYLAVAARYGAPDLPSPPPPQRTVSTTVRDVARAFRDDLEVPDGYEATSAEVTWIASDAADVVVATVGNVEVELGGSTAARATSTAVGGPARDAGCDCELADPFQGELPRPAGGRQELKGLVVDGGKVPVAVYSSAREYALTVRVGCALRRPAADGASSPSQIEVAWLETVRRRIGDAYAERYSEYVDELSRRIEDASAGQKDDVEREAIRRRVLEALWRLRPEPADGTTEEQRWRPVYLRGFLRDFEWNAMTYRFYPFSAGARPPCAGWWPGQTTDFAHPDRLFQRFLNAGSARVLVPVRRGRELAVLYYLAYGGLWPGSPTATPTTEDALPLLDALWDATAPEGDEPSWRISIPTSLLVLAEDAPRA